MASKAATARAESRKVVVSNPCRRARIVAKIRASSGPQPKSSNWISLHKPDGESSRAAVTISFVHQHASRKESYELDCCYGQDEDNGAIFEREIRPLIPDVLVGRNVTVIAVGARGSGKTYTIQGCAGNSGLAAMAVNEILLNAWESGKSVEISSYEVYQDRIYDLLNPKKLEVSVLENGKGKIQLKGLSQVPVRSISEFHKLIRNGFISSKLSQKMPGEVGHRSHKGFMVHVTSCENMETHLVGKMNFVDMAGYEDIRRNSPDGLNLVESNRLNKSIYALHNVVRALNANESHVPYRESKLTRMLQDSLGRGNQILMVACLNPTFCQDTIFMVNLACRSRQGVNRGSTDLMKKAKSSTQPVMFSSSKNLKSSSASITVKKQTGSRVHVPVKKANVSSITAKKHIGSQAHVSVKKSNVRASIVKGRKLSDELNRSAAFGKLNSPKIVSGPSAFEPSLQEKDKNLIEESISAIEPSLQEKDKNLIEESISDVSKALVPLEKEIIQQIAWQESEYISEGEKKTFKSAALTALEPLLPAEDVSLCNEHDHLEVSPCINGGIKMPNALEEGHDVQKENMSTTVIKYESPPISARLQEISNNLKSLYSKTPLRVMLPLGNHCSSNYNDQASNNFVEPNTPVVQQNLRFNDEREHASINSHCRTPNLCSSGMKNSLIKDRLNLLNSASKEELKSLKGIGEKRAAYILKLREKTPEPFKNLQDLKEIGLSAKQIKGMMQKAAVDLFS